MWPPLRAVVLVGLLTPVMVFLGGLAALALIGGCVTLARLARPAAQPDAPAVTPALAVAVGNQDRALQAPPPVVQPPAPKTEGPAPAPKAAAKPTEESMPSIEPFLRDGDARLAQVRSAAAQDLRTLNDLLAALPDETTPETPPAPPATEAVSVSDASPLTALADWMPHWPVALDDLLAAAPTIFDRWEAAERNTGVALSQPSAARSVACADPPEKKAPQAAADPLDKTPEEFRMKLHDYLTDPTNVEQSEPVKFLHDNVETRDEDIHWKYGAETKKAELSWTVKLKKDSKAKEEDVKKNQTAALGTFFGQVFGGADADLRKDIVAKAVLKVLPAVDPLDITPEEFRKLLHAYLTDKANLEKNEPVKSLHDNVESRDEDIHWKYDAETKTADLAWTVQLKEASKAKEEEVKKTLKEALATFFSDVLHADEAVSKPIIAKADLKVLPPPVDPLNIAEGPFRDKLRSYLKDEKNVPVKSLQDAHVEANADDVHWKYDAETKTAELAWTVRLKEASKATEEEGKKLLKDALGDFFSQAFGVGAAVHGPIIAKANLKVLPWLDPLNITEEVFREKLHAFLTNESNLKMAPVKFLQDNVEPKDVGWSYKPETREGRLSWTVQLTKGSTGKAEQVKEMQKAALAAFFSALLGVEPARYEPILATATLTVVPREEPPPPTPPPPTPPPPTPPPPSSPPVVIECQPSPWCCEPAPWCCEPAPWCCEPEPRCHCCRLFQSRRCR